MQKLDLSLALGFYTVVTTVGVVWLFLNGALWDTLPEARIPDWGLGIAVGFGIGLGAVAINRVLVCQFSWAKELCVEFRSALGVLNGREILILATASGVGEEVLFRGAIQPVLGLWITDLPENYVPASMRVGV